MTTLNPTSSSECQELWTGIAKRPPFTELEQRYSLTKFEHLLHADTLNTLKNRLITTENGSTQRGHTQRGQAPQNDFSQSLNHGQACQIDFKQSFKCQNSMSDSEDYYETIIFKDKIIPTRPNSWHDLFNGLIWLNFPKTKTLLNEWHVEDIQSHGLTPRTHRRNQITLFDECGVILAVSDPQICENLSNHQWKKVFIEDRHKWANYNSYLHHDLERLNNQDSHVKMPAAKAFVFGHANYEMLLNPFIGLTGKWLAVRVDNSFFEENYDRQLTILDSAIYELLNRKHLLSNSRKLSPIPLLGIPGWHLANENEDFYMNQDYFRPARSK
ncbi:DUF3025 domain-containing protein [Aliiglaciecola sp. 2_MG-2023]|uniref:DUF3025 domain-containing protein n=1 Tax=unclassified Aliiglaciecola TaxID=2593648 RepID=UPI0026E3AF80|nr:MULTISPECIES: DUF3025 domain-containing protein [unclassified Aliiglaciecola]MDO6710988.1 DUF3025 domain-containing protein [Aliiglaciecola sp. 2_MG-2023]MDO6752469.1 DUF3025 domain-containing protein [Aliiglaciecola sp. 1_MG-2023]